MTTFKRPTASDYNTSETMRKTLSGKADSVFSYRKADPYSLMFEKLKRDGNENLDDNLWQQATNKGELDQYINLLTQGPKSSPKLAELRDTYGAQLDYDTTMLALSYDSIKDDVAEDRFDSNGNLIGKMTQRELIDTVLENQKQQWDLQILEDAKRSGTFWQKLGARAESGWAELRGFSKTFQSGAVRVVGESIETLNAATYVLDQWVASGMEQSFAQISKSYADAATGKIDNGLDDTIFDIDPAKIAEDLAAMSLDIRRKHSYHVNAVTGEMDMYGKILNGMADSIGYMSLAMLTGNPAAMYLPMFTGNVKENVAMSGANVNYSKIMTNAATKAGIEYGIEWGLGKLVGFTQVDKLLGFSDDAVRATQQTVTKGLNATSRQAAGMIGKQIAKDMLKEGTEEVLQELSGTFIDYLYGDQYAQRSKDNFTLENFSQSFIVGAATSFAIGNFQNMTVHRGTGVDKDGMIYKMGLFQSLTYNQSLSTLNAWKQTALDEKADPKTRAEAALKLQGVVATLGNVYESMGIENAVKADKMLLDIQQYETKKQSIKDQVKNGTYVNGIVGNLQNEVGGKNWIEGFSSVLVAHDNIMNDMAWAETQRKTNTDKKTPVAYISFANAIKNSIKDLEKAGATKIDTPVDLTDSANIEVGSQYEALKNLGYNVVATHDGKSGITSGDVFLMPESMKNADIQTLLKEITVQNTVTNIMKKMPVDALNAVIDIYKNSIGTAATKFDGDELAQQAIQALMFDKNFQLKVLLATKENNNTWGTKTVFNFIKNLQTKVVKTFDTVPVETKTEAPKTEAPITEVPITEALKTEALIELEADLTKFTAELATAKASKDLSKVTETLPLDFDNDYLRSYIGKNVELAPIMVRGVGGKTDETAELLTTITHNGITIPFHLTLKTNNGVTERRWYPFLGVDKTSINKGSDIDLMTFYNSELIREMSEYLAMMHTNRDVNNAISLLDAQDYYAAREATEKLTGDKYHIKDSRNIRTTGQLFDISADEYAKLNKGLASTDSKITRSELMSRIKAIENSFAKIKEPNTYGAKTMTDQNINKLERRIRFTKESIEEEQSKIKAEAAPKTEAPKTEAPKKANKVLSDISRRITERMIESLKDAIVVMNTTVKSTATFNAKNGQVELESSIEEVIGKEKATKIKTDPKVRATAVLKAAIDGKLKVNAEVKNIVNTVVTEIYNDSLKQSLILAIMNTTTKPTMPNLIEKIINTLESGTFNERLDVGSLLTTANYDTNVLSKNKQYFLPTDENSVNAVEGYKAKKSLETKLLGNQSIASVLNGTADLSLVNPSVKNKVDDFDTNEIARFIVLNDYIKQLTTNEFAIMPQDGRIVKTTNDPANLQDELVELINKGNDDDLFAYFKKLANKKKDGRIRLQDVFKIKLPKAVGNMPLALTWGSAYSVLGYHYSGSFIHLQFTEHQSNAANISVLFHEMIHAVDKVVLTDVRYNQVGGTAKDLVKQLIESEGLGKSNIDELYEYLTTNFPMTARYLEATSTVSIQVTPDLKPTEEFKLDFLGQGIYYLLYSENIARSVSALSMFTSAGFTWKLNGEIMNLVSPDGKRSWPIKTVEATTPTTLAEIQIEAATLTDQYTLNINAKVDAIKQATSLEEVQDILGTWFSEVYEKAAQTRMRYDDIVNDKDQHQYDIYGAILAKYPNVDIVALEKVLDKFKTSVTLLSFSDDENIFTTTNKLSLAVQEVTTYWQKVYALKNTGLAKEIIEDIAMEYSERVIVPLSELQAVKKLGDFVALTMSVQQFNPTSFNFGDYSFVNHTGRTFMLSKKVGNKFITQEVARDTLLPVRASQKPLVEDELMRSRFLLVIAKKTEFAKNAKPEPKETKAPKQPKPVEKKIVFQWGGWTVKEFDATHYTVSKNVDKSAHLPADDDYADNMYEAIQVVSKKTLLPDTMLGATGKPVLSASERSNILDWIAHDTGPQLLKVQDKEDPDNERWIYRPNLSDKNAEPMTKDAIEDFRDSDLADDIPGNVDANYELGLTWVTRMAKFYKKYPSLRAWVEGMVDKTPENLKAFIASKDEAINLMYGELYKPQHGIKDDYKKTNKELKQQADDFIKTPIYFVRTQSTKTVDMKQPINSVSLGYDLNTLPIFGNKGDFVFYGSILPTDLVGFLPNSYAEGILTSSRFGVNAPLDYSGTEKEVRAALKAKLVKTTNPIELPMMDAYNPPKQYKPEVDNKGRSLSARLQKRMEGTRALDKNGNLITMYHGSTTNFTEFNKGQISRRSFNGFMFTSSRPYAENFAKDRVVNVERDARTEDKDFFVKEVYLKLTNPMILKKDTAEQVIRDYYVKNKGFRANAKITSLIQDEYLNSAKARGFDGIILEGFDFGNGEQTWMVVFEPTQIEPAASTLEPPKPEVDSEGVELTKEQSEFFRNSIVRDENGNLLRMYHGTTAAEDFDTFDINSDIANGRVYSSAFYFTGDLSIAEHYAGLHRTYEESHYAEHGKIIPVYLNITKPVEYYSYRRLYATVKRVLKVGGPFFPTIAQKDEYINRLRTAKGYNGIIAHHRAFPGKVFAVFDSNQIKLVHNFTPTEQPMIDAFQPPKPANRVYISKKRAEQSNLIHFYKKGSLLNPHPDVVAFVEGTTDKEIFDKLSKFFQVRILNGKLTRHDITKFVHTTKTINDTTWRALATLVYRNDALANMGPAITKYMFLDKDKLIEYAAIARLAAEGNDDIALNRINSLADFKKLLNEHYAKIRDEKNNKAYYDKYQEIRNTMDIWWGKDAEGNTEKDNTWQLDELQLLPIFMRHFDGSLKSLDDTFSVAKTSAGHQIEKSLRDNSGEGSNSDGKATKISSGNAAVENNANAKEKSGVYNWLANKRRNEVDYEVTGYDQELITESKDYTDLTEEDKYYMVEGYLFKKELDYTTNPSEQEKYDADVTVQEAMSTMTDATIDKAVIAILAEGRENLPTNTRPDKVDPRTAERKSPKDQLRTRANNLITKLAGSQVAYNNLPAEIKALIEFTPRKSRVLPEAYTNLSEAELKIISDKVAAEIKAINKARLAARDAEKTKASLIKRVSALQKKQQALAEREARVKAAEKALKEGKTLKEKIDLKYDTKVSKQAFTITGPSEINPKLQAILNRVWDKTTTSNVTRMEDSAQTIQNVHTATEFYKEHATDLSAMTLSEIEDITDWLTNAYINEADGSVATQTFNATRFFILSYIYNESDTGKIFYSMNTNLKQQLANYLKTTVTTAGTLLSLSKQIKAKVNPSSIIAVALFDAFDYKIPEAQLEALDRAVSRGEMTDIVSILAEITKTAEENLVPEKVSALRKIAGIRSMSMTSSPMTWVRNIISNAALGGIDIKVGGEIKHIIGLEDLSTKVGNMVFKKDAPATELTPEQYTLTGKITPEIQKFITEQFIDSGFFNATIDKISKYNPSQIIRHKNAGGAEIIENMVLKGIYNQFYTESMFESKRLNQVHKWLMARLSDNKVVRRDAAKFIGKLLAETGAHLDAKGNFKTTIDKDLMKVVANAFALATTRYMHSDNMFSHFEKYLSQQSEGAWALFKTIMPFATASWNWFKAAVRYSPVGLGRAIYKMTRIEEEIIKRETSWQKGDSQIDPALTSYLLKRDLGSGIIGTVAFGFGAILAALGFISLEDDDWGTPKLRVGNLRIDVSSIFGSSSTLAGAAFIQTLRNGDDFGSALDSMIDPLVDGFFFTDLLRMDANSPGGLFEWGKYQMQSVALSFMPSMVRYISGMTYTGTYRTNTTFQKAVARLPFMGAAFNVPKKTDIYTGDQDGTFWDIVHRAIPYFEIVTKSQAQANTEMYGLNKEELNGTYKINDTPFKTEPKETARINKLYGELNADALTDFYSNKATYRVLGENNKYATKRYSQMTDKEISNALSQIFNNNSDIAKTSAWLQAGHKYYTNDRDLFNTLRGLGYTSVYIGNKGFVE